LSRVFTPYRLCKLCAEPQAVLGGLNKAIWGEGMTRQRGYIRLAGEALAEHDLIVDQKTILRHADHVEATWRTETPRQPMTDEERPLTEFGPVMDRISRIGLKAGAKLEELIDGDLLQGKELVAAAKLALNAQATKEMARLKQKGLPDMSVQAIFLIGTDVVELNPHEVRNVTPASELRAEMDEERRLLEERAGA
jgi:hypothetical protein